MAGSVLVRIRGGPFIIYGRGCSGKNEGGDHSLFMAGVGLVRIGGGGTIHYLWQGWAGKNEGGGGNIHYLWQGVGW